MSKTYLHHWVELNMRCCGRCSYVYFGLEKECPKCKYPASYSALFVYGSIVLVIYKFIIHRLLWRKKNEQTTGERTRSRRKDQIQKKKGKRKKEIRSKNHDDFENWGSE